jgi:chloride channel protein, CIC family
VAPVRDRVTRDLTALRRRLLRRRAIEPVMLALGAATGVGTGLLAWVLVELIGLVQVVAWAEVVPPWQLVLVPTLGGLVVGAVVTYLAPEAAGGGVVQTMETLSLEGGRFRARVPLVATLATGLSLGTGASGGREGPIVLIGGALGSLLGRIVPVDEDRLRGLVAAGAAAGIGASFNAPIGGTLFALEVLLGGLRRAGSLQVVVVAAVAGSVTARQLGGESLPLFRARPGLGLGDPLELLLYLALGLAAAGIGSAFRRGDALSRRWFTRLRGRVGHPLSLAVAGFGVGLVALVVPEVLSDGAELPRIVGTRDPIQAMLDVRFGTSWLAAAMLLGLLVAKLVASCISSGAGAAVGIFAPTLFLGAALGGAVGIVSVQVLGQAAADVGAFALVGMAAVFAATVRAPLTAVIIVFELTGEYDLVLPLMLAVGIAISVGELRGSPSIYVQQLRERGVVHGQPEDIDVLQTVTVGEVMSPDHPTVPAWLPAGALEARFEATGSHGFAVVDDEGRLVGVVTRGDLARDGATALDRATRRVLSVTPDDPVFRAVRRMADLDVGRLPVIDPTTRTVVGMLRRSDVVRAYRRGINRSLGAQQRADASRLRDLAGVRFVEVVVDPGSEVAGKAVSQVRWPERTVLTSVRRAGEVIVPTGSTVLEAGDEVVVLTADGGAVRGLVGGTRGYAPPPA